MMIIDTRMASKEVCGVHKKPLLSTCITLGNIRNQSNHFIYQDTFPHISL